MSQAERAGNGPQRRDSGGGKKPRASRSPGRSTAEWITFGISAAIVLGVVVFVSYLYLAGPNEPPIIEAVPLTQELRQDGRLYYLPIRVTNRGGATAADVTIEAAVMSEDGARETSEFTLTFLAGGEVSEGTAVFTSDPTAGQLEVAATSFRKP